MNDARTTAPVYAGERIRAARTLLGVSQTKLGNSLGLTQSAVSQYESGLLPVPTDVLDRVADQTALPRSFFDQVPADMPPVTLRFRKQAKASAGDTLKATQLLSEAYRVVWSLVNERGGFIPPSLPVATERDLSADRIEEFAAETRTALGLSTGGPVMHVTRAMERNGIFVVALGVYGNDDESETIGHFGASCWPGTPEPALVGYFPAGTGDRQRFTLAHELGHLVLHARRTFVTDPESEANRFAGAFLFPAADYADLLDASGADITLRDFLTVKARWGVSVQALIMRGGHIGLIDPARKASLFKQLSSRGWRKDEPVTVHGEHPVMVRKLLEARFGVGRAVYSAAVETATGLPASTLAWLAPRTAA